LPTRNLDDVVGENGHAGRLDTAIINNPQVKIDIVSKE